MNLIGCMSIALLSFVSCARPTQLNATTETLIRDQLTVAFQGLKSLETVTDQQLDYIKYVVEVLLDSWKDADGAKQQFEEMLSGLPVDDKAAAMVVVNSGVDMIAWLHDRLQSSSVEVRRSIESCIAMITNKQFLKANLDTKIQMAMDVVKSFNFTEDDEKELEQLSKDIETKLSSLGIPISSDVKIN